MKATVTNIRNSQLDPGFIAELKKKHPKLCWRRMNGYEILFRPLYQGEWERFKAYSADEGITATAKATALENLVADCMLYPEPESAEAAAMFDNMPALRTVIGNAIVKRAGVTLEVEEGEF
jgi:hypothetical protein